jgi:hypothetical protein
VINPLSGDKSPAGNEELESIDEEVVGAYKILNSQESWNIQKSSIQERKYAILSGLE